MIILKTWACECGYRQNFPQTSENIAIHFNGWGLVPGQCPSCRIRELVEVEEVDLMSKMTQVTDEQIDQQTKEVVDPEQGIQEVELTDEEKQEKVLQREADLQAVGEIIVDEV